MIHHQARMLVLLALLAGLFIAGCSRTQTETADAPRTEPVEAEPQEDPTLIPVTLQLNWYPEAEHGGYFAALAEGYYREAGLKVQILPGGPQTPVVQQVARRAVTFGIVNADNILFGRAQQAPVVALMAPLQVSPRCLIVHASSGIREFDQLKNMTIAMSNDSAFSQYLRKKLPLPGVTIVPYPGNVERFLRDKNYAQQGYVFSEPFVARKEGGDPRVLMLSDLGYNPYTSILFAHEDQLKQRPDLVRKMVEASIKGWEHYLESPQSANELIHKANPEMDLDILEFGATTLKPLVLSGVEQHGIGNMSNTRWQTLEDQLVESNQLKPKAVEVDKAYTTRFMRPERSPDDRAGRNRQRVR